MKAAHYSLTYAKIDNFTIEIVVVPQRSIQDGSLVVEF